MKSWWTKTDGGFWVEPRAAEYTVAVALEHCWAAIAECAACGRERRWPATELQAAFPPAATFGAIARRLRCGACGSDQGRLHFRNDPAALLARDVAAYQAGKGRGGP